MKKVITLLCLAMSFVSFGQSFNINTSNASVSFKHIEDKAVGTLTGVQAKINIDPSNLKASTVSGSVDVSTLSTKNKMRDKHLKSADFFDAAKYPTMKFVSGEIVKDGDNYKAKGKLTIRNTTKDVTFTVTEKDGVLKFKTTVYAFDYGVEKKEREKSKVIVVVKIPLG